MKDGDRQPSPDAFQTTHWSLVLSAGHGSEGGARSALEKLCHVYWQPLYVYVRRRVAHVEEAQDLTQAFFERLLEKQFLADADPERGRFRTFLITAFKHFLSKEWDKARAAKRGGDRKTMSLDFAAYESSAPLDPTAGYALTPEQTYARQWATSLLKQVMLRLREEMERNGKGQHFRLLRDFIANQGDRSYTAVADELGQTESAARMAASRLRRRYRELLREEIAQTVSASDEVEDEIRQLFAAFAK